jgi:hypothetical protein
VARINSLKNGVFKMKITTMKRPDGKNQYKITLPKDIVEEVRKRRLTAVGEIWVSGNDVLIEMSEFLQDGE